MSVEEAKIKEHQNAELYALGVGFNGTEIVPIIEAQIPLVDMGFMHSDV